MRIKLMVLTGAVVLAAAGSAFAGGNGVVASAHGHYGFTGEAAGSVFDIGPFEWKVKIKADGSVRGEFDYTQVRDGVPLTVSGSLTCAVIQDGHVWVGGIIEASSRASLVGLDMWFQGHDYGEGAKAEPDMSSTVGAAAAPAGQQYCDDHPPVRFPFLVSEGNLQVHSG